MFGVFVLAAQGLRGRTKEKWSFYRTPRQKYEHFCLLWCAHFYVQLDLRMKWLDFGGLDRCDFTKQLWQNFTQMSFRIQWWGDDILYPQGQNLTELQATEIQKHWELNTDTLKTALLLTQVESRLDTAEKRKANGSIGNERRVNCLMLTGSHAS